MKNAMISSTVYLILLTGVFFNYAASQESLLQAKLEQSKAHQQQLDDEPEAWIRLLISRAYSQTESGIQEKPVEGIPSSVSQPSNFVSFAIMSACNPRINPCF